MIRNLKILGLALTAVCVISAMLASAASASPTFTSTAGATLQGEELGNVKFTVTGSEVFCEESSYHGVVPANIFTEVTVTPSYNKCFASSPFGTLNASVVGFGAGGCDFVLRSTGNADLVCPAGKEVTINASPCVVHIPGQKGLEKITYTTTKFEGKNHLSLDINITKITSVHTDGFLCPFGEGGHNAQGVLEGNVTAKATVAGVRVDLTDHK